MMQSGVFETPDWLDEFTPGGTFEAAQALATPKGPTLDWMSFASMQDCEEPSWEKFPAAVLIHAMAMSSDTSVGPFSV
jgi:hypothetical protein